MGIVPGSLHTVCHAFSCKAEESSLHEACDDSGYASSSSVISDEDDCITVRLRTSTLEIEITVSRSSVVYSSVQTELCLAHSVSMVFCGNRVDKEATWEELGCEEDAVLHVHDHHIILPRHLERLLARIESEGTSLAGLVAKRLSKAELGLLVAHIEATGQECPAFEQILCGKEGTTAHLDNSMDYSTSR